MDQFEEQDVSFAECSFECFVNRFQRRKINRWLVTSQVRTRDKFAWAGARLRERNMGGFHFGELISFYYFRATLIKLRLM